MRIISPKLLREFSKKHAAAESSVKEWVKKTKEAEWKHFPDVRLTFRTADQVTLPSQRASAEEKRRRTKTVVIFNVGGNDYRVIVSINYRTGIVYTLFALTHTEYEREEWKKQL